MSMLKPVIQNLYPTCETLEQVITLANSKIPIGNKNEVYSILMSYHNTMLKVINENQ